MHDHPPLTTPSSPAAAGAAWPLGAFLAGDRRRALAAGATLPDRTRGAALFADISGFTPLTEALAGELGAKRGADELTTHLDRVFEGVIGEVHRFGGDVVYFAGDAIICWFDGDDGVNAAAAGLAVQRVMAHVGRARTPAGAEVLLAIKVAVAVGPVRRFVVGDPAIQLLDVLAGRIVDELADAERAARQGEVVLAPSAVRALGRRAVTGVRRPLAGGDAVAVLDGLAVVAEPPSMPPEPPLADELARAWVLPAVYERLASGQGAFLAELRPAYPMFVRFTGIDYDVPGAAADLDGFVSRVQGIVRRHGGNVLQIVLGDKGAYVYAVFGSPHAHEDDAVRACAAAVDIVAVPPGAAVSDVRVGIAHGRLRSGTSGHPMRRTFTCLGDAVNVAARLMARATAGEILLTDEVRAASPERLRCDPGESIQVKGRGEQVGVSRLRGVAPRPLRRAVRFPLPIVGRAGELDAVASARDAAFAGTSRVVGIAADAGRGKSRLVAEVVRGLRSTGATVALGEAPSFAAGSYAVWREVWRTLLGLDDSFDLQGQDEAAAVLAQVGPQLATISAGHGERAPLLGSVIGVDLADNATTAAFSAKLRKSSLEALLADVLCHRAGRGPLTIVLEDCHWIDPLSRDLLDALVRAVSALPVLFVLAYRPSAEPGGGLGLEGLAQFRELVLDELDDASADLVTRAKLAHQFGPDVEPAPELVALITTRAGGNPFYLEELVNYVQVRGLDPCDPAVVSGVDLPDSLHRLVLGRVDALPAAPRTALSVASVVGAAFDATTVHGTYRELGSLDDVEGLFGVARGADLVALDRVEDRSWRFRHAVTHDVVYDSLPNAMRVSLHGRAGTFLESLGPDAVQRDLDVLAAHFWLGDDDAKKRDYLVRAGIAAQARYANAAAVDYFSRVLPLLAEHERPAVLRRLGKVLELHGTWADAERTFGDAIDIAVRVGDRSGEAWARTDLADVMRRQGRFDDARRQLGLARAVFAAVGDTAGDGLVLHLEGTLASQQGHYAAARAAYEASLAIREHLGDRASVGALLSNLALVAENEGDLDEARRLNERALAQREAIGDRWAIAVSLNNLGMIAQLQHDHRAARDHFDRSMRLADEVGDRWVVAVGRHNLANAHREMGEFGAAGGELLAALSAYTAFADRWSIALLVEDAALLAAAAGRFDTAVTLVAAADVRRAELDAPRPPVAAAALESALVTARTALGASDVALSEQRGQRLDAEGIEAVLRSLAP